MPRALLGLFVVALALYCATDVLTSTDERRGNAPKFMWILVVVFLPILGPIIWLVFVNGRRGVPAGTPGAPGSPSAGHSTYSGRTGRNNTGQVAPDDDPEFLWKLAAEQRRKREAAERAAREAQEKKSSGTEDSADGPGESSESNNEDEAEK